MNAPSPPEAAPEAAADAPSSAVIAVLPIALANQIAAGEVVERPASVVKELVENAIDSGALRILIDLEGAGRALIRVVDDGSGMTPDDAARAVLRHATSKIHTVDDLMAIDTLGFRGEALPSIASVSNFTLTTRRPEDSSATAVTVRGGALAEVAPAAAPPGTRIEVRDLFWNVPARLKFLKSDATERQHVQTLIKDFALGYPHIHFRLGVGERAALDLPAVRRLQDRVVQVLGRDVSRHLFEVRAEDGDLRVMGFVTNAREARATTSGITCFINGRRVRDRTLQHAIVSAFGSELTPGRFPQAVLWVHIAPAEVDVNVHPTKAEVRFRDPQRVHATVARAIQRMLLDRPWVEAPAPRPRAAATTDLFGAAPPPVRVHTPTVRFHPLAPSVAAAPPAGVVAASPGSFRTPAPDTAPTTQAVSFRTPAPDTASTTPAGSFHTPAPSPTPDAAPTPTPAGSFHTPGPSPAPDSSPTTPTVSFRTPPATPRVSASPRRFHPADAPPAPLAPPRATLLRFGARPTALLGTPLPDAASATPRSTAPDLRFLAASSPETLLFSRALDLFVVDTQAAITLWTLATLPPPPRATQPLLFPARLDLTPQEAKALLHRQPDLARLGLDLEPFGGPTFQLLALPEGFKGAAPGALLGALATLLGPQPDASLSAIDRTLAACLGEAAATAPLPPATLAALTRWLGTADLRLRDPRGLHPAFILTAPERARRLRDV